MAGWFAGLRQCCVLTQERLQLCTLMASPLSCFPLEPQRDVFLNTFWGVFGRFHRFPSKASPWKLSSCRSLPCSGNDGVACSRNVTHLLLAFFLFRSSWASQRPRPFLIQRLVSTCWHLLGPRVLSGLWIRATFCSSQENSLAAPW